MKTQQINTDSLDTDTQRNIKEITERGYYERSQTLGKGGWGALATTIANWRSYRLYATAGEESFDDSITARDNKSAIAAFESKYHLADLDTYTICEEVRTNIVIKTHVRQ